MHRQPERLYGLVRLLLLLGWVTWCPDAAAGHEFLVEDARGRMDAERFLVDARIGVRLDADVLEALENGVALEFELQGQLLRPRRFWWDARVARATRRLQLMRHTLTGGYTVAEPGRAQQLTFKRLDEALGALGEVRDFELGDAGDAADSPRLRGRLRLRLNIEALPAPLRPIAYVSPGWHLSSGWHEWWFER
jgi:hypothetical protein